jgi:hypothetical protein
MSRISPTIPFDSNHPDALAMYCSDGRFTRSIEALLVSLGYQRLDTLTIPGGAALLDYTSSSLGGIETARTAMSFLITGHDIKHVVLIAHESCGYYSARYPYDSAESLHRRQLSDLDAAARWLRGEYGGVDVSKFFAWRSPQAVEFERLE